MKLASSLNEKERAFNSGLLRAAHICDVAAQRCIQDAEGLKRSQRKHYEAEARLCVYLSDHIKAYMIPDVSAERKEPWWFRWFFYGKHYMDEPTAALKLTDEQKAELERDMHFMGCAWVKVTEDGKIQRLDPAFIFANGVDGYDQEEDQDS